MIVKVVVATVLIGWLVRGGNLDIKALRLYVDRPALLIGALTLFTFAAMIAILRFRVLLGIADVKVKLSTLLYLQFVAFFFNVVIPGNIGGDVVKALYVARDEAKEKRTTILMLVFVERLLGVAALIFVGAVVVLVRGATVFDDPLLRPLAATVVSLAVATVAGGLVGIVLVQRAGARLDRYTTGPSKISKLLNQLVASLRLMAKSPRRLVIALALSMSTHTIAIAFFTLLTRFVLDRDVPYSAIATVFPLGLLALLLPISPAGLGVGHVAFARLFEAIQLPGGATVFNVYLLGQMVPCLLGVFPFLSMRRKGEIPNEVPAEPETGS